MSGEPQRLIAAIRDQTQAVPHTMVFVIDIVSVRFGGKFTPEIKAQLQKFPYLQMLTLNDCAIQSLQNFPHLPSLIRLDLVFNSIPGEQLKYLKGSRHLQTLMLGANKIQRMQHLFQLKNLNQLLQLDLINNPITKLPGYRQLIFGAFPSLTILDTLDKGGKDAYTNQSMIQAVSRVPDTLFEKVQHPPISFPHVHKEEKKKLSKALARVGSLDSVKDSSKVITTSKIVPLKPKSSIRDVSLTKVGKSKKSKAVIAKSSSRSSKAGLTFPVGRIKRKLKVHMSGNRVGIGSAIYMAAILQYLSAEVLQIAGNQTKAFKKNRITPEILKQAIKKDQQIHKMLQNVTLRMI